MKMNCGFAGSEEEQEMTDTTNNPTRREFLKGTAATAAALGLGLGVFTEAHGRNIGPDDTINAAFIGTGSHGCHLLTRGVKVDNVKWLACCDIREDNLNRGLSIAKGAEGYKDYRKLLERKDIHAVVIATPIALHAPMTIDALRAGKHVLCEKMMAHTIDDAKRMLRVGRQTGLKLQIGHQRRYSPQYQHVYQMIKQGIIGKITHVRAQWNRNGSWRRPCPDPAMENLINWRLYRKSSQGLMGELGSHQIDVVNWMLGETPSEVIGVGGLDYWKDGRDIFDNVQAIFEYPSGVKVQYQSLTTNQFDGHTEQFMGDQGTVILSTGRAHLFREPRAERLAWEDVATKDTVAGREGIVLDAAKSPREAAKREEGQAIGEAEQHKDDYQLELEDFFLSIRDGHEPLCSSRVALDTCIASIMANDAMDKKCRLEIRPEIYRV